jgi:hypothetical protein
VTAIVFERSSFGAAVAAVATAGLIGPAPETFGCVGLNFALAEVAACARDLSCALALSVRSVSKLRGALCLAGRWFGQDVLRVPLSHPYHPNNSLSRSLTAPPARAFARADIVSVRSLATAGAQAATKSEMAATNFNTTNLRLGCAPDARAVPGITTAERASAYGGVVTGAVGVSTIVLASNHLTTKTSTSKTISKVSNDPPLERPMPKKRRPVSGSSGGKTIAVLRKVDLN